MFVPLFGRHNFRSVKVVVSISKNLVHQSIIGSSRYEPQETTHRTSFGQRLQVIHVRKATGIVSYLFTSQLGLNSVDKKLLARSAEVQYNPWPDDMPTPFVGVG
jgi:hypothetical protein